ncbi:hypothetical protein B0H11DRAFT_1736210, partial [Mycena galericulata]
MSSTASSRFAWVEKHASKLPTLHKGELTPLVIDDMELACINYFNAKDTDPDKQVGTILGCFMDPHFTNWTRPTKTRERLIGLKFPEFMKEFKDKFLDDDWETQVRTDILSMRQTGVQTFDEFATALIGHTSLLADTTPIDDVQIRHHLEAGMSEDLRFICMRNKDLKELIAKAGTTLDQYIRAVNRLDEERRRNLDIQRRLIADANKENKRRYDDDGERPSKKHQTSKGTASKPASSSSTTEYVNPFPPKLTDAERDLLRENEGCNRCRRPFAGHRSAECTDPMTSANVFKVTEKLVADARKARKGKGAATSSGASTSKPGPIAAIMPPAVLDSDTSGSVETDDDLSRDDVSRPSVPHSIPHLVWTCLLDGPNVSFPIKVNGLIDNGSHLVIINKAIVDELGLRVHKLPEPEEVSLALDSSPTSSSSTASLSHYVKL